MSAPSAGKVTGAQSALLPDGRLHLQHGPIDLIVDVDGPGRPHAYRRAVTRFQTVLEELVADLPALRQDIAASPPINGAIGRAMARAVAPFQPVFVTPMAAVAGAVADAMLADLAAGPGIERAYVNNGGDVALRLTPGAHFNAAIVAETKGRVHIRHDDAARGVATSGWRGRSHSLGIADAVTVLAKTAAAADAAATLIANAVDLPGHPAITRTPASELFPDSDLGDRPVTVAVEALTPEEALAALASGQAFAAAARARDLIVSAALVLNGEVRIVGEMPHLASAGR